jgi:hypothetical protein
MLDKLCELAHAADDGFDRAMFAAMLRHVDRFDDEDFTDYGLAPSEIAGLRARVSAWRTALRREIE